MLTAARGARVMGVRSFAKAAAKKAVKREALPVNLHGVHGTYAGALFQSAGSVKAREACLDELNTVVEVTNTDVAFQQYLRNPTIQRKSKAATMAEVMKAGGFSTPTSNFFKVLAENGRLSDITKIAEQYAVVIAASRGEVVATVTSAEDLTKAQLANVTSSLKNFVEKGKTVKLTTKVDPEILGGLTVQVGDRYMDLSISTKIKKMKSLLAGNV